MGYGRVGRRIPVVVVEQNRERVERARRRGIPAVSGDSTDSATLTHAHIATAAMLVIATPDPFNVQRMAEAARASNPNIEIAVRTHSAEAVEIFRKAKVGVVFFDEDELVRGMQAHILSKFAPTKAEPASAHGGGPPSA